MVHNPFFDDRKPHSKIWNLHSLKYQKMRKWKSPSHRPTKMIAKTGEKCEREDCDKILMSKAAWYNHKRMHEKRDRLIN